MSELYNRIFELCQAKGISIGKMCNDLSISRGNLTELKMERIKTLKSENLSKIAAYFDVSVDYLLGNKKKPVPAQEDEQRDIARELDKMMEDLENSGDLMFDGYPATPEAIESIRNALAMGIAYARQVNREKKPSEALKK